MASRTPFDEASFRMIDVGAKRVTRRTALATGWIALPDEAYARLRDRSLPKGDAMALAEIAGVLGAKAAAQVIPMCHPLPLDQVRVAVRLSDDDHRAHVYAQAVTRATTGVEMEALAAVNAALLTIWDLCKAIDPDLEIGGIRLLEKTGGKSGRWLAADNRPDWLSAPEAAAPLAGRRAAVVVLSDRAAAGEREDRSGPTLHALVTSAGADCPPPVVLPDDPAALMRTLRALVAEAAPDLILTSGGTGLGPRDTTPEVVASLCDRQIPGLAELLRQDGAVFTRASWLSRAVSGLIGTSLVVTLPGSPKAVREGWEALAPILPHALRMIAGEGH